MTGISPREMLSVVVATGLAVIACVAIFTVAHLNGQNQATATALMMIATTAVGALGGALALPETGGTKKDEPKP